MQIESIIRRSGGTQVILGSGAQTILYHFKPVNGTPQAPHVAEVELMEHVALLLAIPEGYRVYAPGTQYAGDMPLGAPIVTPFDTPGVGIPVPEKPQAVPKAPARSLLLESSDGAPSVVMAKEAGPVSRSEPPEDLNLFLARTVAGIERDLMHLNLPPEKIEELRAYEARTRGRASLIPVFAKATASWRA